jgi:GNAT superfamily N-acetyltransferase
MLARRFALPPVNEAMYEPRQIPNAAKDMGGTVLIRPPRETWMQMLGEMVQMVNEAVRRRASSVRDAAKPLSLEYMADRLDIDDPLLSYLAVSKTEGWMQGFITATTWTTWHQHFRWDSLNPALDLTHHHGDDDDDPKAKAKAAERPPPVYDADGSLAIELQAELRAGDPEEGVVWPRVAELSLLGALGCGRWLVELLLEELESEGSPYRYIVTQATDGSIPFYERMGFVRVGAVIVHAPDPANGGGGGGGGGGSPGSASGGAAAAGGEGGAGKKRKSTGGGAAPKPQWVSSGHTEYRSMRSPEEEPEIVSDVCARLGVAVDDFLFLNAQAPGAKHPKLKADSALRRDAKYLVPTPPDTAGAAAEAKASHDVWHVVDEDKAFKRVAEEVEMDPRELLAMNKHRPELKGLQVSSELIGGTRLLVKPSQYRFDEYCHWTFADDDQTKGEPSYMMARRLKPIAERKSTPEASSTLAVSRANLLVEERPPVTPSGKRAAFIQALEDAKLAKERRRQEWEDSAWVVVAEDLPFKRQAELLGMDAKLLRDLNAARLKGLQLSSLLKKDTWLQIKSLDELGTFPAEEEDERKQAHAMVNRVVQIDGEDDYEFW